MTVFALLLLAYGLLALVLGATGLQERYPVLFLGASQPRWGPPLEDDLTPRVLYVMAGLGLAGLGAYLLLHG